MLLNSRCRYPYDTIIKSIELFILRYNMIPELLTIAMWFGSSKVKEITPSLGEFLSNGYPINELNISRTTYFAESIWL